MVGPFVDMDVLDAELLRPLQVLVGPRVGQLIAAALALPLGRVELHTLKLILLGHLVQRVEAGLLVARIERAVQDETVGMRLLDDGILLDRVEPSVVEVGQVRRLQDGDVVGPVHEQVLVHLLGAVLVELLLRPNLVLGAERGVVAVETVDELLAVNVLLVRRAGVPIMHMPIDDENIFAVFGLIQVCSPFLDACCGRLIRT